MIRRNLFCVCCFMLLGRRQSAGELSLFAAKKRRKNRHRFDAAGPFRFLFGHEKEGVASRLPSAKKPPTKKDGINPVPANYCFRVAFFVCRTAANKKARTGQVRAKNQAIKQPCFTSSFPRPDGRAGPRRPAYTGCPEHGHTCRSRGGSCRGLPPTADGHGRGGYSPRSRSHGKRAGSR